MPQLHLKTLLGEHAVTAPLKRGEVSSSLLSLEFADVKVPNTAFKRVVRNLEFDVAELAIVTFLMARAQGVPLCLLPTVLMARFQHPFLLALADGRLASPADLNGKRIGIRSYTVTTVVWLRSILANDYGIDLDSIEWITFEDAHVAGFTDPPNAKRAAPGKDLKSMLKSGEIDAVILPGTIDDPRIVPLISDPAAAARDWAARNRAIQINHMIAVKSSLSGDRPEVPGELMRLFTESKAAAKLSAEAAALTPFGIDGIRHSLEIAIDATFAQKLIPRRFSVDELFAPL